MSDHPKIAAALAEWRRLEGHQPDGVRMRAALVAGGLSAPPSAPVGVGGGDSEPMTGDLLPCPFCGKSNQDRYPCEWLDGSGANVIRCAWCHGAAPMNVWNRRTAPPSAPVGAGLPPIDEGLVSAADDPRAMNAALVELANALGCDCELSDMLHRVDQLQESHEEVETARDRAAQREAQATDAMRMLWLVVRTAGSPRGVRIDAADLVRTDWGRCALRRDDDLASPGFQLQAVERPETAA